VLHVLIFVFTLLHTGSNLIILAYFLDSLYMALSGTSLEKIVKPELRSEWEREKTIWFPSEENYAHDLREPGNLKPSFFVCFLAPLINKKAYTILSIICNSYRSFQSRVAR